jgi:hypothetical protein
MKRFVQLDGGKRLVFCSSFDGTWDQYIDDFATTTIGQDFDQTWGQVLDDPAAAEALQHPALKRCWTWRPTEPASPGPAPVT